MTATRTPIELTDKHIGRDYLSNGYIVSTVRLLPEVQSLDSMIGFLQNMNGDDTRADLLTPGEYETMVFLGEDSKVIDWLELDFRRYFTEDDAKIGHEEVVTEWLSK